MAIKPRSAISFDDAIAEILEPRDRFRLVDADGHDVYRACTRAAAEAARSTGDRVQRFYGPDATGIWLDAR